MRSFTVTVTLTPDAACPASSALHVQLTDGEPLLVARIPTGDTGSDMVVAAILERLRLAVTHSADDLAYRLHNPHMAKVVDLLTRSHP